MKPKKAIKELRKQLTADPSNVVLRIRLASLLRDVGEHHDAVVNYLIVARSYDAAGRTGQALAVCKGVLEFAPDNGDAMHLHAYLEGKRQAEQAPALDPDSPLPPLAEHSLGGRAATADGESARRKRPTSMPTPLTPLTHRGSDSGLLPGLKPTSTGRTNRVTEGPALSTRRLVPDNTVPGAPPDPSRVGDSQRISSQRFRLQDLNQAAQSQVPGSSDAADSGVRTVSKPAPSPPLRLPLAPSGGRQDAGARPPHLSPALNPTQRSRNSSDAMLTRSFERKQPAAIVPPALEPPPTPTPPQGIPKRRGPDLEDATIVNPDFDVAAYMAQQEAREEDLPDLPGAAPQAKAMNPASLARVQPRAKVNAESLGSLQALPRYVVDALVDAARIQTYPDGAMVVSAGEPIEECRVILRGLLRLLKRDPLGASDALVNLGTVGPGEIVGTSSFMNRSRDAQSSTLGAAVAIGSVEIVEIPQAAIDGLRERFPTVETTLELFYRERCLDRLMSTSPIFASLSGHDRAELVGMFEPVRAAAGQFIIEAGTSSGGFYFVLSGELEVAASKGNPLLLAPGAYVGDVGVLQGQSSSGNVRATKSTELGRLDSQRFYELITKHPDVWSEIWRVSRRSKLEGAELAVGTAATI